MTHLADYLLRCTEKIEQAGASDSARLDAEVLILFCLDKPRSFLYAHPEYLLQPDELRQIDELINSRVAGHPVAYLVGKKEFWSLPLYVDASVLIPRPATECLVAAILELPMPTDATVIDLGAGSGAIALALASERPDWFCIASERQQTSRQVLSKNVRALDLAACQHILQADWLSACAPGSFDLVVSNPPYIDKCDPHLAEGDVRYEPLTALISGNQGMEDIELIAEQAGNCLKEGGYLALEHGYEQQDQVVEVLQRRCLSQIVRGRDLAGQPRFVVAQKKSGTKSQAEKEQA